MTDTKNEAELKPCPFCGSTLLAFSKLEKFVSCTACGADGPIVRTSWIGANPRGPARDAWNRRTVK